MLRLSPTRLTVWGTEEKREYRRGNLSFLVGFPQFSQVKKLGRASPQFPQFPQFPKLVLNFSSGLRKLGRASPQFPQFPKLVLNFSSGVRKLGRASPQFPQFPKLVLNFSSGLRKLGRASPQFPKLVLRLGRKPLPQSSVSSVFLRPSLRLGVWRYVKTIADPPNGMGN